MKVALYSRVSTEEQANHGFSIQAQKDELERYANEHNYSYEHYSDEGYSGGTLKRPGLQRLLTDVQKGKVKLIVFVKLDRWFRSVPQYYEIQKVLEEHNCNWVCTQEDYETETSSGRFKVNIMLSVSQQFKDATSERIKSVFNYKMSNGYTVSPQCPVGFKTERTEKGVVIKVDDREMLEEFVAKTDEFNSLQKAREFINDKYNISITYHSACTLIHSPLLYGMFHGKQIFEPIVSKETIDRITRNMSRHNPRNPKHNEYIFKSLLVCPKCGSKMIAYQHRSRQRSGALYVYARYRCDKHYIYKKCDYASSVGENALETYLVSNFKKFTEEYIIEQEQRLKAPKIDKNKIEKKLKRLNDMYLEDKCTKEYFDDHYKELKELLTYEEPKIDNFKRIIEGTPMEMYNQLTVSEKNYFWRLLIKSIKKSDDGYDIEWL